MREVAIIGTGMTKFGELWDRSLRDLSIEAGLKAVSDAGVSANDLEALFIGTMASGRLIGQENMGALVADFAGLAHKHLPATRVEAGEASGALALRQAYLSVASGEYDLVLVGGAEKMTDVADPTAVEVVAHSLDQEWEAFFGATAGSLFAMMARRHMHEHGTTREELAVPPVKNHGHAVMNDLAHYPRAIRTEDVLNALPVAEPLGMMDFAPLSDGAAALVLASVERAREVSSRPLVRIAASSHATDTIALHDRSTLTGMPAVEVAGRKAFSQAGCTPSDIHVAELHDSVSINEIMALEDLGFAPKGKAGRALLDREFHLGGRMPVNTSGGMKARGMPLGASGVAQVHELVLQLRGEAGDRQVEGAKRALAQNIGGTGSVAIVHILEVI